MKVCEILDEFEFLSAKEKQRFLLKAWNNFHNEICDEDFMQEFLRNICNNKGRNNTQSLIEDIIHKMNGAQKL